MNQRGKARRFIEEESGLGREPILTTFRGSITHGTYEAQSIDDIDLISVVVPSADHYLGLSRWGSRGTREVAKGEWDLVAYELHKALGMMRQANPNILSMLWVEPEDVVQGGELAEALIGHRDLFATKLAYQSFVGYAYGQLKRIDRSTGRAEKIQMEVAQQWVETGLLRLPIQECPYGGWIPQLRATLYVNDWATARWLQNECGGELTASGTTWHWKGTGASAARLLRVLKPLVPAHEQAFKIALDVQHRWTTRGRAPITSEEQGGYKTAAAQLQEPLSRAGLDPGDPEDTGRYDTAYMGAKRRAMVEQHGYDTKNASHLIRLLRMGGEFLRTGELIVQRPDASELLAIKHGEWSLEKVKKEAERLFEEAEYARDHSELPDEPKPEDVNLLASEIVKGALGLEYRQ